MPIEKLRVSLVGLIGVVLLLAIIFAGLRSGSNDWFKSIYTLTFILLIYAAIAARYRGAFWYGFAIAGWAYFLLGFGSGSHSRSSAVNRNLVSSIILEIVSGTMAAGDPSPPGNFAQATMLRDLRWANRDGICHSGLTVVFASLGGLFSRRMAARAREGPISP
jgi:hypothetical protein